MVHDSLGGSKIITDEILKLGQGCSWMVNDGQAWSRMVKDEQGCLKMIKEDQI